MHAKDGVEVEIIRKLMDGGYVSGQTLSGALGVSRTAVWKHIEALRKSGFSIEASPRKGYRLEIGEYPYNGVGISSALKTEFIGRKLFFYDEIDSTNVAAFEFGRSGEEEGAAVVADSQVSGKGRVGRQWRSPPGVNLYTSVVLRPTIMPKDAHMLTFLSAVAVAGTVDGFIKTRPVVKWPNDILVNGKKVAGILMEMDAESDRVNFIIAGVGVNINSTPSLWTGELEGKATSVMEVAGAEVSRVEFISALYSNLEKWYKAALEEGFTRVLDSWKGYFASEGKPVRVSSFGRTIEGLCMGIDRDGALLVKGHAGKIERVISGDVQPIG